MPFFSVIIPTYNRESLVARTLDSIFAQEETDFEVIVMDDGSTDRTLEILRGYGDRIRVIQQKQRGPGAARNAGIAHACGQYLAFLDSDDLWFPWSLATYRQAIEANGRPAFVVGTPFCFHEDPAIRAVQPAPLSADCFSDYLASGERWRWFGASSFVVRKDQLDLAGGFCDHWINGEDADLALKLGVAPGFVHITSPFCFAYREHAGTAIANIHRTWLGLLHMIQTENRDGYPGGPLRRPERLRIITRHSRPASLQLLKAGLLPEARAAFASTWKWQFREARIRYLLGFAAKYAWAAMRHGSMRGGSADAKV